MSIFRPRHGWREPWLRHHMQPVNFGRMLGNRRMVDRQVVHEDGLARTIALDDRSGGNAFAATIADHFMPDAVIG
jgi:hypothetical protein